MSKNYYCTGCGAEALSRCRACGEWRCNLHISEQGGWCELGDETKAKGVFCAKNRDPVRHILCDLLHAGAHAGVRRKIRVLGPDGAPYPGTPMVCETWTQSGGGHRWREEPEESFHEPGLTCTYGCDKCLGHVQRLWYRVTSSQPWHGPVSRCELALTKMHETFPGVSWQDYETDEMKAERAASEQHLRDATLGFLSSFANNLGRGLARKMRVPYNEVRNQFPGALGTPQYFKGGVGGSYGAPYDGVRYSPEQQVRLADGKYHGLALHYDGERVLVTVDDLAHTYRCPAVEEPSQPLGMQPSCAAMRSCYGGAGTGKLVRGVWRDMYRAADDWSRPMYYCEACIAGFLAEGIGFEWKAIDEDAPADVGQRPEAAKTKMETQTCTDCGVEVCVPPYLMEGRCCNCHEAQAQRAHKQWLKDQASRESAPVEADFETNVLAQTYCENAPPREIVESTPVMLDGDEVGGVPKTPFLRSHLCWNQRMKAEWERHEAWSKPIVAAAEAAYQRGDVTALMAAETCRPDHDSKAPTDTDQFGGRIAGVSGMRCKLCGGWIRIRREV